MHQKLGPPPLSPGVLHSSTLNFHQSVFQKFLAIAALQDWFVYHFLFIALGFQTVENVWISFFFFLNDFCVYFSDKIYKKYGRQREEVVIFYLLVRSQKVAASQVRDRLKPGAGIPSWCMWVARARAPRSSPTAFPAALAAGSEAEQPELDVAVAVPQCCLLVFYIFFGRRV